MRETSRQKEPVAERQIQKEKNSGESQKECNRDRERLRLRDLMRQTLKETEGEGE